MSEKQTNGKDWDIAFCGLNCARCDLKRDGNCGGCKGSTDCHHSPDCKILTCGSSKGEIEYCFQCDEFPCEILQKFATDGYDHHRLSVENLRQMKACGLENWLAAQPEPKFCPGWII